MLKLCIREIAEKQGFNRNRLQLRSSVTLPLLTRYWNNTTKSVRLDALEKIASALDVAPTDLIVFAENNVPKEADARRRRGTAAHPRHS